MTLRTKFLVYLGVLHAGTAATLVVLLRERPALLVLLEASFLVSLLLGWRLVRALFVPLDLVRTGAELIEEKDFGSQFRPTGQPEIDALVDVYNRMIERLREERLRLTEQNLFLDKVLDSSPAGIVVLDHDGRVASLNPAAAHLLGVEAAAVLGRTLGTAGPGLEAALAALPGGASRVVPFETHRRARCTRLAFLDRGFTRDFFLIEELTDELRTSEREAYQRLVRMMSHEVKNSTAAVGSLLTSCLAWSDQLSPADREDFVAALNVSIERMRHLDEFVSGFADVVRLPAPEPRTVSLRTLLDDIAVLLRPELARRRIAWRIDAESDSPDADFAVHADKNQLEQVLVNVLRNAMEAIGEDGAIRAVLALRSGRVRIEIHDSGPGIAAEAAGRLFTPFFTTKRNGRGLGLTLVREVLAQHHAHYGLSSTTPHGAVFWAEIAVP